MQLPRLSVTVRVSGGLARPGIRVRLEPSSAAAASTFRARVRVRVTGTSRVVLFGTPTGMS